MTGRELHRMRKALGFRCMETFGRALGMDGADGSARRMISRYETSAVPIPWYIPVACRDLSRRIGK